MENNEQLAAGAAYDINVARGFFESGGQADAFPAGTVIFSENEKAGLFSLKRNRMYLLLEGEVHLGANGKVFGSVAPGEIFGEMASFSQAARSASATARRACRVLSLDDRQFQDALRKNPEFALMMMSVMIGRLRRSLAHLKNETTGAGNATSAGSRVFERKLLNELVQELGENLRMNCPRGMVIMQEGQVGDLMYIVLEGRILIFIRGTAVEKIGSGAVFGEMALVEKGQRLATAVTDTDCSLLAINRSAFLDLIRTKPQFGMTLLSAIGERARKTTARI